MQSNDGKIHAPVVMIGYNREWAIKKSLTNLSQCKGVEKRDVFVYIDAPYRIEDARSVSEMIDAAQEFKNKIPKLRIISRSVNYGVPGNLVEAITEIVNKYGRIIFFEDDVLVSRTFLEYMDEGLEKFESDPKIWSINGYCDHMLYIPWFYSGDVFLSPRVNAWGFGTWKDRWNAVDFSLEEWKKTNKNKSEIKKIEARLGWRFSKCLNDLLEGKDRTWDYQCTYHMYKNDLFAITPRKSLTKNIGLGVDSVHCQWCDWNARMHKYFNFMPKIPQGAKLKPCFYILRQFGCKSQVEAFFRGCARVVHRFLVKWGSLNDECRS
jgi:hypothetical protein